jgi:hypothetical protein
MASSRSSSSEASFPDVAIQEKDFVAAPGKDSGKASPHGGVPLPREEVIVSPKIKNFMVESSIRRQFSRFRPPGVRSNPNVRVANFNRSAPCSPVGS